MDGHTHPQTQTNSHSIPGECLCLCLVVAAAGECAVSAKLSAHLTARSPRDGPARANLFLAYRDGIAAGLESVLVRLGAHVFGGGRLVYGGVALNSALGAHDGPSCAHSVAGGG